MQRKYISRYNSREDNSTNSSLLLWLWLLADVDLCNQFQLQVKILNAEEKVLLSVTSSIHSLGRFSWKTIIKTRRGVFLDSQTVEALTSANLDTLLDIEILKLDEES